MHELSVAHAVVSTVVQALPSPGTRVLQVRLRIGELSGIVPQALEFAYDVAAQGTPLADAALVIERSPIVIACPTCGDQELASATDFRCPSAHGPAVTSSAARSSRSSTSPDERRRRRPAPAAAS